MRELERRQPSGYTDVKNFYDHYAQESRKARESIKNVKSIIESLKMIENEPHMTKPSITAIRKDLEDAIDK